MSLALRSSASYAADRPPTISRTDAKKSRKMFAPRMASPETSPKYLTAFFPSILGVVDRIILPSRRTPHTLTIGRNLQAFRRIPRSRAGCSKRPDFSPSRPQRLFHPPALSLPRHTHCPGTRLVPSKTAAALLTLVSRFTPHFSRFLGWP